MVVSSWHPINSSRLRENGCHLANIYMLIFLHGNCCIFIKNSLIFISKDLFNSLRPSDAYMHYLNQCWIIVNWTLRNKLQWSINQNSNIFIQENAFESVVCETATILSRPQCVKKIGPEQVASHYLNQCWLNLQHWFSLWLGVIRQ